MANPLKIFSINKDEKWPSLVMLLYLVILNAMAIYQHFDPYTRCGKIGYYSLFNKYFNLSGFDPFTYIALSDCVLFIH